jgi:tetratricopeptide (TPR) repeat protein
LLALDDFVEAETHFRTSLKLKPNDASALNNLGVCLQKQHRMKDAALAFKAAILIDPTQDVSKSNAKYAISQFLSYGAILAVLIQLTAMAAFFVLYAIKMDPAIKGFIALFGGLLTVALMTAAIIGGRTIRTRQLESADPQILAIYKSLNQDRTID